MKQFKWIPCFLFIVITTTVADDEISSSGFNGYTSFGQSTFPFSPFINFRYPFGRDSFRPLGPGFYPPKWNFAVFGGEYMDRIANRAMCFRALGSEADETKVSECASCFDDSQTQRGLFSRTFDLKNYSACAKDYLGEEYTPCADTLSEDDSGNDASAVDVFRFKGCIQYNRWIKNVDDCKKQYSEDQSRFFQCMISANSVRIPLYFSRPLVIPNGPSGNPNESPANSIDSSVNPDRTPQPAISEMQTSPSIK